MTLGRQEPAGLGAEPVSSAAPLAPEAPETVVLRLRRHGRHLVLPVLVLFGVSAAAGFWVGALPSPLMNVAALAAAGLVAVLLGLLPILAWLTNRATITTRRVILRRGVFVRHRSEVALRRVREVRTRRSIGQRLYGSGDIELLVGVESARISDVPWAEGAAAAIRELVEQEFEHSTGIFASGAQPPMR